MSNSSNLNGPSSVSMIPGGVWKIQKNRRTDDRKNQNHDKEHKDSGDRENKDIIDIKELGIKQVFTASESGQEQSKPSADDDNKNLNLHKVDLVI